MKKYTVLIVAILLASFTIFAQEKQPDFQTVKTEKGMMVLNNNKAQPFAFLVAGNNPEGKQNQDGSLFVQTDRQGLNVYFIKTADFLDGRPTKSESETLYNHREWDVAAQEKAWGKKLEVKMGLDMVKIHDLRLGNLPTKIIPTFNWTFPNPQNANISGYYQTVVMGDLVVMLGTSFDSSVNIEEVKKSFTETFESFSLLPPQKAKVTPKKKTSKGKKN